MHAYERSPAKKNSWLKEPEPKEESSSDVLWPTSKAQDQPKFEAMSGSSHQFLADKRFIENTEAPPADKPWHVKKPSFDMPAMDRFQSDTY